MLTTIYASKNHFSSIFSKPTPSETELLPVKWKRVTNKDFKYLEIGEEVEMRTNLNNKRIQFWNQIAEKFMNRPKDEL